QGSVSRPRSPGAQRMLLSMGFVYRRAIAMTHTPDDPEKPVSRPGDPSGQPKPPSSAGDQPAPPEYEEAVFRIADDAPKAHFIDPDFPEFFDSEAETYVPPDSSAAPASAGGSVAEHGAGSSDSGVRLGEASEDAEASSDVELVEVDADDEVIPLAAEDKA